jgi:regulator of cell morphogenesis and NO signaling
METTEVLDITVLTPTEKHSTVFQHFDSLHAGEAFYVLNDHDPKPLYYQLVAEKGKVFDWKYEQQGPVWWKVLVKKK